MYVCSDVSSVALPRASSLLVGAKITTHLGDFITQQSMPRQERQTARMIVKLTNFLFTNQSTMIVRNMHHNK